MPEESCMPNRRKLINVQLLGPYWGNVLAMIGQFLAISTISLLLNAMLNYLDHIGAMFGPY